MIRKMKGEWRETGHRSIQNGPTYVKYQALTTNRYRRAANLKKSPNKTICLERVQSTMRYQGRMQVLMGANTLDGPSALSSAQGWSIESDRPPGFQIEAPLSDGSLLLPLQILCMGPNPWFLGKQFIPISNGREERASQSLTCCWLTKFLFRAKHSSILCSLLLSAQVG